MRWLWLLGMVACAPQSSPDDTGDPPPPPEHADPLRIATWNVNGVGTPGSDEYEATAAILRRLDADLVGLNEVDGHEADALAQLAEDAGYTVALFPDDNPFGDLRNALLARIDAEAEAWTSASLSGDADADDVTRLPLSVTVDHGGRATTVVVQHWKAGFDDIDAFRRSVESHRALQAAERAGADDVVLVGDVNHEEDQGPGDPAVLTSVPDGAPWGFELGDDLRAILDSEGLSTDPFVSLRDGGLEVVLALQPDGRDATRDASGRRIDYVLGSAGARERVSGALIYDARDDDDRVTLPLDGPRPERTASEYASDHFPVLVELQAP